MLNRPARLCMIGAGRHASSQIYPLFPRLRDAAVVANADLDLERARIAGSRHGVPRHYDDWRRMIASEQPDGCLVCVGAGFHAEVAVELMRLGIHVLVEKPHAPNLAASLAMLEASRATGRICMGAYKKRHAPAYLRAREAWTAEGFGDLCHIGCYRGVGASDKVTPDHLWGWGCHVIDLMPWIGGPVEEIHAVRSRHDWRSVTASLRFTSGATGSLTLVGPGGNWEDLTVLGRGGHAVRVSDGWRCTVYDGNDPCGGYTPSFAASGDGAALMGFLGEIQAFVAGVHSGLEPDGSIESLTHTVAIHEALMRSLASGHPESVALTGDLAGVR